MDLDELIGVVVALNSLFSFASSIFLEALTPEKAGRSLTIFSLQILIISVVNNFKKLACTAMLIFMKYSFNHLESS